LCVTQKAADSKPYNEVGLGRCSEEGSKERLTDSMRRRNKPEDDYQEAAHRLNLLLSGPVHDIFALDVYYYKSCYTNFVREKEIEGTISGAEIPGRCEGVKEDFLRLISKKILEQKKAYFLTELIHDTAEMSSDA